MSAVCGVRSASCRCTRLSLGSANDSGLSWPLPLLYSPCFAWCTAESALFLAMVSAEASVLFWGLSTGRRRRVGERGCWRWRHQADRRATSGGGG